MTEIHVRNNGRGIRMEYTCMVECLIINEHKIHWKTNL